MTGDPTTDATLGVLGLLLAGWGTFHVWDWARQRRAARAVRAHGVAASRRAYRLWHDGYAAGWDAGVAYQRSGQGMGDEEERK